MSTTRRLPTRDELRIWREYLETADALRAVLGARLQSDSGISSSDYTVLLALDEADGHRLRSSALATQIGWERSRVSHHLARMERRGLIAREDCPTDNRGAEIVLTATGAGAFADANGPHLRAIREVFVDALNEEQLAAASDLARALRDHLSTPGSP